MDEIILKAYKDNGFPGNAKLKTILKKKNDVDVSIKAIKEALKTDETQEVYKKKTKKIQGRIVSYAKNERLNADLVDMQSLSKKNKGNTFILIVIDIFSRFVYAEPLKNKTAPVVASTMDKVLNKIENPKIISTDSGNELANKYINDVYLKHKVAHTTVPLKSHHALGVIDSAIRNIKNMIYKTMNNNKNSDWINILQKIVDIHNSNPHTALDNVAPEEVKGPLIESEIHNINFLKATENVADSGLSVGDKVRLRIQTKFKKRSFEKSFSDDIFEIVSMKRVNAMIKRLSDDMVVQARLDDLQKTSAQEQTTEAPVEHDSVAATKKDKKIDNIIQHKEGLEQNNIIEETKLPIGTIISIKIKDDTGKYRWYKATVVKKIRNKYKVEYENNDTSETLDLTKETYKILTK